MCFLNFRSSAILCSFHSNFRIPRPVAEADEKVSVAVDPSASPSSMWFVGNDDQLAVECEVLKRT